MASGSPPVTLITGAASGIGLASARALARRGDVVALVDLDASRLEAAAAAIRAAGGTVRSLAADVLDGDALTRFASSLAEEFGALAYAFGNAGLDRRRSMAEMTLEEWTVVLDTHVTGSFTLCQAVLPHMVRAGSGAVLLMASDFAVAGLRGQANYTAAKTAIYSMTKALALEFAPCRRSGECARTGAHRHAAAPRRPVGPGMGRGLPGVARPRPDGPPGNGRGGGGIRPPSS